MSDATADLRVVDGLELPAEYKAILRPGETLRDAVGRDRQLPRHFYEIPSWDAALKTKLSPNFELWEFIQVDVREAELLRRFPRYVPCAISLFAVCLQRLRDRTDALIHISANGGYRSPGHRLSKGASPHCWGTAANIYRVGDTYLDNPKDIERFAQMAYETLPGVWTRTPEADPTEDHLHLDIGYVTAVPRDAPSASPENPAARSLLR